MRPGVAVSYPQRGSDPQRREEHGERRSSDYSGGATEEHFEHQQQAAHDRGEQPAQPGDCEPVPDPDQLAFEPALEQQAMRHDRCNQQGTGQGGGGQGGGSTGDLWPHLQVIGGPTP
jgi:hypothetical protein